MDNNLQRSRGSRLPTGILDVDLPGLARAVTAAMRGQAAAEVFRSDDRGYVRIVGLGVEAVVSSVDWAKVLIQVRDETFTTAIFPVKAGVRSSTVDSHDPLYARVYGCLALLFTAKVPT